MSVYWYITCSEHGVRGPAVDYGKSRPSGEDAEEIRNFVRAHHPCIRNHAVTVRNEDDCYDLRDWRDYQKGSTDD